jgi:hypothetical protein
MCIKVLRIVHKTKTKESISISISSIVHELNKLFKALSVCYFLLVT